MVLFHFFITNTITSLTYSDVFFFIGGMFMKLHVDLKENGYDIILERGCLYRVSDYIDLKRKVMIITDDGVPLSYAKTVQEQCQKG